MCLEPRFRQRIGCHEKPPRPSRSVNVEAQRMIIRPENWNPARCSVDEADGKGCPCDGG